MYNIQPITTHKIIVEHGSIPLFPMNQCICRRPAKTSTLFTWRFPHRKTTFRFIQLNDKVNRYIIRKGGYYTLRGALQARLLAAEAATANTRNYTIFVVGNMV